MQRMAAKQPPDGAWDPANNAVVFNSLVCVVGARWSEATGGRQPWRNYHFVGSHHFQCEKCNPTHLSAPRRATNSMRNSSNRRSLTDRLGFSTKSNPGGIDGRDVRRISLTLLLTRFLSCALPSFRGVVSPNRL